MNIKDIISIGASVIASIGGSSLLIYAFSNWLGKIWASRMMEKEKASYSQELEKLRSSLTRDVEQYRVQLKKSEFWFQKQYEAASSLSKIRIQFTPAITHPEMDILEAREWVAKLFPSMETSLDEYFSRHAAVLTEGMKKDLWEASNLASHNKFGVSANKVSDEAAEAAGKAYDLIMKAEAEVIEMLKAQVTT